MTGINLVTTILKMRAPGMSYMRMPVFCWTSLLALAFGALIVCLIAFGSLWVMGHLNHNMVPTDDLMQMQR
jgi:cytochrome o ubiquinol oxidase subunit 1